MGPNSKNFIRKILNIFIKAEYCFILLQFIVIYIKFICLILIVYKQDHKF